MNNKSNIYDIDGDLIRGIDDTHKLTIKEARKLVDKYKEKLDNLPENDPKRAVYTTYMRNLTSYVLGLYSTMSKEEIEEELKQVGVEEATKEAVEKALNELKESVSNETESVDETESVSEEPEEPKPTVMDEYVDYEEVPDKTEEVKDAEQE